MRKKIYGKWYNTKKDECIAYVDDFPFRDFFEALYYSRHGNYYIYGYGDENSRFCKTIMNSNCEIVKKGGVGIIVISRGEASAWLKKHEFDISLLRDDAQTGNRGRICAEYRAR